MFGFKIVPNPYMPENTIVVGPRTYEMLTGENYEEAVKAFGKALRERGKPAPAEGCCECPPEAIANYTKAERIAPDGSCNICGKPVGKGV